MATPESITLNLRNIGGTSGSGFIPMPDELKYPAGYFAPTVMPLQVIRPAPPEAVVGFFSPDYYGYVGRETQIRITMQGGAYPYAYVIDQAPAGATISNDPTDKENYSVLKFTPTANGTQQIVVRCYDQDGKLRTLRWTFTTSEDWCVFVEPTGVDSAGRGSFTSPFKTLQYARNNTTGGKALILKNGTYTDTELGITLSSTSVNSVLAWSRRQAIIDLVGNSQSSPDILFYINSSHMLAQGLVIRNPQNLGANPRIFSGDRATDYVYQDDCSFEIEGRLGTSNGDNVACFFLGSTSRRYLAQTRCEFSEFAGAGNGWSAFNFFTTDGFKIECNTYRDQVSSTTTAGMLWVKGLENRNGDITNNAFLTPHAGSLIDVYLANDILAPNNVTGNIDISFNLIRGTGLQGGVSFARSSQGGARLPVWSRRNTLINTVVNIWRRSYSVVFSSDSDVIQSTISSSDPWKIVVLDANDPENTYRPLSWMPSLTASVTQFECHANSGVVDSNGILIGTYAQYRGRRGHEIRKGAI